MRGRGSRTLTPAIALILALNCAVPLRAAERWVGTWEAAPAWVDDASSLKDETLREIVHISIGGNLVRVRFSNTFGAAPLLIARATIGRRREGAAALDAPRNLTFSGNAWIVIPPHAQAFSDPLAMMIAHSSDLLVSIYVPGLTGPATFHPLGLQTNYYAEGDRVADVGGSAYAHTYQSWYLISGVDVAGTPARGSVVALGDSITDGAASKPDANGRWPDVLARRLLELPPSQQLGVLNAGISGNRILLDGDTFGVNALARFDRDVIAQSGVRDVIVLLGINDIQQTPHQNDPLQIEAGLRQLVVHAHERGLRIFACTITPFAGWREYSIAGESAREAVNTFIRTSKAFDGIFDFDLVLRDPTDPHRMLPAYDGGDHLHPNTAGLGLMGSSIELNRL